jgi:hypothetical protein
MVVTYVSEERSAGVFRAMEFRKWNISNMNVPTGLSYYRCSLLKSMAVK